jgi:hypothetical protein
LGDPVDYNELNFQKRVKDLAHNKITKSGLSSKVIETWINDTLIDAGHLNIPGVILKPESKKPMTRYGIDRNQLVDGSIQTDVIDRIYRALFVYSLGFFEMIQKSLADSP